MKMGNSRDELMELDRKHFLHPTSSLAQQQKDGPSFIFTRGKGIYLEEIGGRTLIDGMSSLWNVNIGHGRDEMADAAAEQMKKLAYSSSFAGFSNEPAILLAAKIAGLAPGDLDSVFFTSGGSEANDTAIKLARHYWQCKGQPLRQTVISRDRSYHGVSVGATSATGLKPFRDFTSVPQPGFAYAERGSAESLRAVIEAEGPETIAAFLAEPVQGAGGVNPAPEGYFREIRKLCSEYGILLIADEVITGFGRTGSLFGMNHYGTVPDMMVFAKGITSGYAQLGGVILAKGLHEELASLSPGTLLHGFTYSGHPTACAVALKNLEIIENEKLIRNAHERGAELLWGLERLKQSYPIADVRGLGLMAAMEFKNEKPAAPLIVAEAARRGLICRSVSFDQDTVVLAPPLITSKEEISVILDILDDTLGEIFG